MLNILSRTYWKGKNALYTCTLLAICWLGYGAGVALVASVIFEQNPATHSISDDIFGIAYGILGLVFGFAFGTWFANSATTSAYSAAPYFESLARVTAAIIISLLVPLIACQILKMFFYNFWIQAGVACFTHYLAATVGVSTIFELIPSLPDEPRPLGTTVEEIVDVPKNPGLPPRPNLN